MRRGVRYLFASRRRVMQRNPMMTKDGAIASVVPVCQLGLFVAGAECLVFQSSSLFSTVLSLHGPARTRAPSRRMASSEGFEGRPSLLPLCTQEVVDQGVVDGIRLARKELAELEKLTVLGLASIAAVATATTTTPPSSANTHRMLSKTWVLYSTEESAPS